MDKKIRVLQVNKFYSPWIGGVESVCKSLAEGMSNDVEMRVLVCQPKGRCVEETIDGISVTKAGSIGTYFSMPVSFSFFRLLRKMAKNADIVQLHDPFPLGDLALLLSGYKGKTVVWWHSDIVKQKKLMLLFKPIMKRFLRRVDRIFIATESHINSSKYLGEYKNKCSVVPYGINAEEYTGGKTEDFLTEKLKNGNNKKVLFVGRLVYYKGIDVLINAFSAVTGAELFVVGAGVLEEQMRELCNKNGIAERVHFLGKLPDDSLKKAFADCDLFAFPSVENSEAFGIVQLEAMIYGKPIINTNLPTGVPTVSVDGVTGITVEKGDTEALAKAMQVLIDNSSMRQKYGENAKKRVNELYTTKKMSKTALAEYINLLNIGGSK